jgi:hypothetical protein
MEQIIGTMLLRNPQTKEIHELPYDCYVALEANVGDKVTIYNEVKELFEECVILSMIEAIEE